MKKNVSALLIAGLFVMTACQTKKAVVPVVNNSYRTIVDKLVELGIDASRLTAVGKGQYSPVADNATEEGRAKNRRVVFVAK